MLTPRVRSIVPVGRPQTQPQEPINLTEVQDAAQRTVLDKYNQSVNSVVQGNENNAQILRGMVNDLSQTYQFQAAARTQQRVRQPGSTGEDIVRFAGLAYDVYQDFEQRKAQAQAAVDEQQRAENLSYLEEDKQKLLQEAEAIIRDPSQGFGAYNRRISEFIANARNFVPAEAVTSMAAELYAPARSLMNEEAEAYYGTFNQIYDTNTNQHIQGLQIQFSSQLWRLANLTDPTQAQEAVNTLLSEFYVALDSSPLTPLGRLQVTENILTQIREQYGTGSAQIAEVAASVERYQLYVQEFQNQVVPLQDAGDYRNAEIVDATLRAQYQIPASQAWGAPGYNLAERNRVIGLRETATNAMREGVITAREFRTFERDEVLMIAMRFMMDPSVEQFYQSADGYENNSYFDQASELADSLQAYRDWINQGRPNVQRTFALRREQIQEQAARIRAGALSGQGANELLRSLSILSTHNSAIENFVTDPNQLAQLQGSNSDLARILQQIQQGEVDTIAAQNEILGSLDRQLQIINDQEQLAYREFDNIQSVLQQWGINSPDDFTTQAAVAAESWTAFEERLRQWDEEVSTQLNTLPNFSLPQLDTYTFGSTEAIIPFRSGGLAQSGGYHNPRVHDYGASRDGGTRQHAGVDFAVPVGTEIISYTQGTVTRRWYNEGGFGWSIEITAPDGTRHLFADLQQSGMALREGDQVVPGQLIGLTGNSGNGSAHLHWGIYRAGTTGYGFGDSINPYEYTAGLRQNMQPRQATQVNQQPNGTYRNAYAPSSREAYRRGQGFNNDASNNYGYQPLAQNRELRLGIHRVAQRVGIPAQWLADIMAFETGGRFSTSVTNSIGATGLIQFYEDRPGSGTKTIGGRTYRISEIRRMNLQEQLDLTAQYLIDRRQYSGGEYNTIWDVLLSIWSNPQNQRRYHDRGYDSTWARNLSDGNINFDGYAAALGRHAGRRYEPPGREAPVHTRLTAGCSICSSMSASNFVRHQGQG